MGKSFLINGASKDNRLLLGALSSVSQEMCEAGVGGPSAWWGLLLRGFLQWVVTEPREFASSIGVGQHCFRNIKHPPSLAAQHTCYVNGGLLPPQKEPLPSLGLTLLFLGHFPCLPSPCAQSRAGLRTRVSCLAGAEGDTEGGPAAAISWPGGCR